MNFATSKILGGLGALLIFTGVFLQIPFYGGLPLIGLILVLAALWGLAGHYKDQRIFKNALYGSILGIVGIFAVGLLTVIFSSTDFLREIIPSWNGDWTTLPNIRPEDISMKVTWESIFPFLAIIILTIFVLFLVSVAVAYFYRKSLERLADRTDVGIFKTTGTLLLIGAIFNIILVGMVLVWIAMLLLAISFFSMSTKQSSRPTA